MIYITASAAKELQRLARQQGYQTAHLVIDVGTGGCLELFYHLSFAEQAPEGYTIAPSSWDADKSPFPGSEALPSRQVAIAPAAQPYLGELKIDYSEDLLGGGFRFHNPSATSTCGCGQSFSTAATPA